MRAAHRPTGEQDVLRDAVVNVCFREQLQGEAIFKACGDNDRAAYGKQVLQFISERLTAEFGAGFTERNLRNMRQFYLLFPIRHTLCAELSWSHYRVLMRIQDKEIREFYANECS